MPAKKYEPEKLLGANPPLRLFSVPLNRLPFYRRLLSRRDTMLLLIFGTGVLAAGLYWNKKSDRPTARPASAGSPVATSYKPWWQDTFHEVTGKTTPVLTLRGGNAGVTGELVLPYQDGYVVA